VVHQRKDPGKGWIRGSLLNSWRRAAGFIHDAVGGRKGNGNPETRFGERADSATWNARIFEVSTLSHPPGWKRVLSILRSKGRSERNWFRSRASFSAEDSTTRDGFRFWGGIHRLMRAGYPFRDPSIQYSSVEKIRQPLILFWAWSQPSTLAYHSIFPLKQSDKKAPGVDPVTDKRSRDEEWSTSRRPKQPHLRNGVARDS
jgi:hypothetical protein